MRRAAVILAAGKGTRMPSDIPKVMHEVGDKPMVLHVIDAIRGICNGGIFLVVGYMAEKVIDAVKRDEVGKGSGIRSGNGKNTGQGEGSVEDAAEFVHQREQLGTGHAVLQCEDALSDFDGTVIVLNGDVPCLTAKTIKKFADYHDSECAAATVMTATVERPAGYGRIVRDSADALLRIVEEKDASDEEKTIREINSGLFCFDKTELFGALRSTDRDNAQNEYYLTDVIDVLKREGKAVRAFCVDDPREVSGVNTVEELETVRRYIEGMSA